MSKELTTEKADARKLSRKKSRDKVIAEGRCVRCGDDRGSYSELCDGCQKTYNELQRLRCGRRTRYVRRSEPVVSTKKYSKQWGRCPACKRKHTLDRHGLISSHFTPHPRDGKWYDSSTCDGVGLTPEAPDDN